MIYLFLMYAGAAAVNVLVIWLLKRPRCDVPLGQHDCDEILNAFAASLRAQARLLEQGTQIMAKIDDLNEAVAQLAAAVAALPSRLPTEPNLQPALDGVKAATDAVNAINPTPPPG